MFGARKRKQKEQIAKINYEAEKKITEFKEKYDDTIKRQEEEIFKLRQTIRNYDELVEVNKSSDYVDPVTGCPGISDEERNREQFREAMKDTGMPFI